MEKTKEKILKCFYFSTVSLYFSSRLPDHTEKQQSLQVLSDDKPSDVNEALDARLNTTAE